MQRGWSVQRTLFLFSCAFYFFELCEGQFIATLRLVYSCMSCTRVFAGHHSANVQSASWISAAIWGADRAGGKRDEWVGLMRCSNRCYSVRL